MRKSVFSEYFYLCAAIISASVICIVATVIVASAELYKNEKKLYLQNQNGDDIIYTTLDEKGFALECSETQPCSHLGKHLGHGILSGATREGYYRLGRLEGYHSEPFFNILYEIKSDDNPEAAYLLTQLSAEPLTRFLIRLIAVVLTVTAVLLAIILTIIYQAAKRQYSPIKEMVLAAKEFGEGDFSRRLDVTAQNDFGFLANSLNEMAGSLRELEESRKHFISNISHEFKTPLTTIGGFIDGILDGTIRSADRDKYLQIASEEVTRLARMVRSMLDISIYEAGQTAINKERFDIIPIFVKTLRSFEDKAAEKNVKVNGLDRNGFIVDGDPDLLGQVVYNIVDNAVKFVNEGGYIQFEFKKSDDMSVIIIRNSGQGLNEHEISRIFDRFYKADESRGVDKSGAGLGLSIVRSLIKLHGGAILVRSEYGHYVEFEINLR